MCQWASCTFPHGLSQWLSEKHKSIALRAFEPHCRNSEQDFRSRYHRCEQKMQELVWWSAVQRVWVQQSVCARHWTQLPPLSRSLRPLFCTFAKCHCPELERRRNGLHFQPEVDDLVMKRKPRPHLIHFRGSFYVEFLVCKI